MPQGDCLSQMNDALSRFRPRSVFLVVDRAAYELSGARIELEGCWRNHEVVEFDDFSSNPRFEDVLTGLDCFRRTPGDVIVAIGGGTAIDVAKLIRCFAGQQHQPEEIIADNSLIESSSCPLIATPTTAGTGSETTHFAVLYRGGEKLSVAHPSISPDVAILDWRLTRSAPAQIAAETGLDALSQAIESIWSIHSTEISVSYAVEAMELILGHLESAVRQPTDENRAAMLHAAHLSGRAIDIAMTTAPHAISYTITHDFGVAHGQAVALTLGPTLVFNAAAVHADLVDPRGLEHLRSSIDLILSKLDCHDAHEGSERIATLMETIGCKTRLSQLQIEGDKVLSRIADSVNIERLGNNPRRMNGKQLMRLLESIE
jgi:alcohol dehydrogenase class IV